MYGDDFALAACLFSLATVWITAKAVSWSEIREHKDRVWISIIVVVIALGCLWGSMKWIQTRAEEVSKKNEPAQPHTENPRAGNPQPQEAHNEPKQEPHQTQPKSGPKVPQKQPNTALPQPTSHGSIIQNNSGGVNVQQGTTGANSPIIDSPITIGNLPKTIAPKDMDTLKGFFLNAKAKCKVLITADQHNSATPLPQNFLDALISGNWTATGVTPYTNLSAAKYGSGGAMVMIRGEPEGIDNNAHFEDSEPIFYVLKALETEHVPYVVYHSRLLTEDTIKVDFVGIYAN